MFSQTFHIFHHANHDFALTKLLLDIGVRVPWKETLNRGEDPMFFHAASHETADLSVICFYLREEVKMVLAENGD